MNTDESNSTEVVVPVLELRIRRALSTQEAVADSDPFTAAILPGQLVYVHMEHLRDMQALASIVLGLSSTTDGVVKFCGSEWRATSYDQQFYLRSKIGRVFAGPAWIQNLTVAENLWLAQLNQGHTRRAIKAQINEWLPKLARGNTEATASALPRRPAFVNESILQICQLVRALAFQPRLLILEWPLRFLPRELHQDLVTTLQDFNKRGVVTVWFDTEREPAYLRETTYRRWEIRDQMLIDCEAA